MGRIRGRRIVTPAPRRGPEARVRPGRSTCVSGLRFKSAIPPRGRGAGRELPVRVRDEGGSVRDWPEEHDTNRVDRMGAGGGTTTALSPNPPPRGAGDGRGGVTGTCAAEGP